MKKPWPGRRLAAYAGVVAACFLLVTFAGWTPLAARIDNYAYDYLFGRNPPKTSTPQSIVLALDEATFRNTGGGTQRVRTILAEALELMAPAQPKAVAIDLILADTGEEAEDARLERAMRNTHNLVLSCDVVPSGWEDPLPRFQKAAGAVGHIHAEKNKYDGVSRSIPLEKIAAHDRRWALSLEAFRLAKGGGPITDSPDDVEVAGIVVPAPRVDNERALRVRYRRGGIPTLTVDALRRDPTLASRLKDKVVFLGVTALTYARDRWVNPFGEDLPGVEIHAHTFETIAQGDFLTTASDSSVLGVTLLFAVAAGLTFWMLYGWGAYVVAGGLLVVAHFLPGLFFRGGIVFPYFTTVSAAWIPVVGAGAYQYFAVRRQLRKSESDKKRYQQAIHFVTHEMRTPLTAIQGSSELMGRYNLNDDKRRQIAQMINSESKRLARMIQTFLDVERLSEGQIELKHEQFAARNVIESCVERGRPLAERKQIRLHLDELTEDTLVGDRELMEYAIYNLVTNAIKYSPSDTDVRVAAARAGELLRLSVKDQGIGMDAKELRQIFKKFYRTKRAEATGEAGTGIGLSIVEQIVTIHGGRMEVTSAPGQGSTFTIVMPRETVGSLN